MNDLVLLKGNDIFTNSLVIAEGTENKHRSVQRLIDNHVIRLEIFGRVRFEITPLQTKGGMQEQKIYQLNEQQATFLLIKCFFEINVELIGIYVYNNKGGYKLKRGVVM